MKIKEIKIREDDGSYSDAIPVGADAINVDMANGNNMEDEVQEIKEYENYYDEITYETIRAYNTTCYFTYVPKRDKDGNLIYLYVDESKKGPLDYALTHHTSLTMNAFLILEGHNKVLGQGEVLVDEPGLTRDLKYRYLCLDENRRVFDYPVYNTTIDEMKNAGATEAFCVFYQLIKNSKVCDFETDGVNENYKQRHPRQTLGVKENGDIVILSCDGRTNIDQGLLASECANLLLEKGCINAWMLDGGGSVSTVIRGSKLNKNIDNNGTTDRDIRYSLNAKKIIKNTNISSSYSKIGEEKQNLIKQIIPLLNNVTPEGLKTQKYVDGSDNQDCNVTNDLSFVRVVNMNGTNKPVTNRAGYLVNLDNPNNSDYSVQLMFDREDNQYIWKRFQHQGTWSN